MMYVVVVNVLRFFGFIRRSARSLFCSYSVVIVFCPLPKPQEYLMICPNCEIPTWQTQRTSENVSILKAICKFNV